MIVIFHSQPNFMITMNPVSIGRTSPGYVFPKRTRKFEV